MTTHARTGSDGKGNTRYDTDGTANLLRCDHPPIARNSLRRGGRQRGPVLYDGTNVAIRQVQPKDAALLAGGFARLSPESRHSRFLAIKAELNPAELDYFTEVDHHHHEALGALSRLDGRGLGIARYIRDPERPEVAEIAITIVDDWQGRGLGTELLRRLADRAYEEGITHFTALVASDNLAVVRLLKRIGVDVRPTSFEPGAVEYDITLAPRGR